MQTHIFSSLKITLASVLVFAEEKRACCPGARMQCLKKKFRLRRSQKQAASGRLKKKKGKRKKGRG